MPSRRARAPAWLLWLGIPCVGLVGALAARLVWEQTIWTWQHGPATVGNFLVQTPLGDVLLFAVPASLIWPVAALVVALEKRCIADRKLLALLAAYCIAWGLMLVPYGSWQRLFIGRFSRAQAIALLVDAAGEGDVRTVRAVLDAGIPADARGPSGTALHAAAAQGQLKTMACLIARGADVNAIDVRGASPMAYARRARTRSAEAQRLLAEHGGLLIEGRRRTDDREGG